MKKRKSEPKPTSAAKKKKQNNKDNKNTLPPNNQNKIWQYLRDNKKEETNIDNNIEITTKQDKLTQNNKNQNNEKPTFKVMVKPAVGDNIRKFQELSNKNNQCVIGSGRCGSHNVKLVREVKQKKMSVIGKNGELSWSTREVTILTCPAVKNPIQLDKSIEAVIPELSKEGLTNGSGPFQSHGNDNQSASRGSDMRGIQTLPLDRQLED